MIALMAIAALADTKTPTPLQPAGKWVVDYQKDMCIASRAFGVADDSTLFGIKPSVSMEADEQTLFFVMPKTGGDGVRRGEAVITLQPSGEHRKVTYLSAVPKGTKVRGFEMYADSELTALLAQSTVVSMKAGGDELSFATGKVGPVLEALKTCNESLFKSWGVDPTAMAKSRDGVYAGNWFPWNAYPEEAKRRGAQGRSVIALTVSKDGLPTACRVIIRADPNLDATTCRLAMRNGKFEASPEAKDRYAILAVRWQLD